MGLWPKRRLQNGGNFDQVSMCQVTSDVDKVHLCKYALIVTLPYSANSPASVQQQQKNMNYNLHPLYTGAATFLPPLCDHKTGQVAVEGRKEAERLPGSFNGGTQDVQTSPWTPWSPWSFEHVQNSRTKVAEEVGRSQVAQRRQEEGTHIAVVAEWMHSGRPLVAPWKIRTVVNIVYQFEQRLCLPCTTIVPPLADQ